MLEPQESSEPLEEFALSGGEGLSSRHLLRRLWSGVTILFVLVAIIALWPRIFPPPPYRGPHLFVSDHFSVTALQLNNGQVVWTRQTLTNSLIATDEVIVTVGPHETLTAFDAITGRERWTLTTWQDQPLSDFTPLYLNGILFLKTAQTITSFPPATTDRADLYALNPLTGGLLWHYGAVGPLQFALLGAPGMVIVGDQLNSDIVPCQIAALNSLTGQQRWQATFTDVPFVVPEAIADGAVVVASRGYMALDLATGTLRWQILRQANLGTHAIASGMLFSVILDKPTQTSVAAYDLTDGSQRWHITGTPETLNGDLLASATTLLDTPHFLQAAPYSITALAASTGAIQWQSNLHNPAYPVALVNGVVLFNDASFQDNGALAGALDLLTGNIRWLIDPHMPVITIAPPTASTAVFTLETGTVRVINLTTGQTKTIFQGQSLKSIATLATANG